MGSTAGLVFDKRIWSDHVRAKAANGVQGHMLLIQFQYLRITHEININTLLVRDLQKKHGLYLLILLHTLVNSNMFILIRE